MTTRQISETIEDIYGFETSESFISDVTDKILPQIEDWQNRPLDEVYPILYIDAIHYSVRDNGVIRKLAAYVILGINTEGKKEVLTISVGDNESAKYWLSVMNELKNRGVKDVLIICADGLTGIKEAIAAAFPKTICLAKSDRRGAMRSGTITLSTGLRRAPVSRGTATCSSCMRTATPTSTTGRVWTTRTLSLIHI